VHIYIPLYHTILFIHTHTHTHTQTYTYINILYDTHHIPLPLLPTPPFNPSRTFSIFSLVGGGVIGGYANADGLTLLTNSVMGTCRSWLTRMVAVGTKASDSMLSSGYQYQYCVKHTRPTMTERRALPEGVVRRIVTLRPPVTKESMRKVNIRERERDRVYGHIMITYTYMIKTYYNNTHHTHTHTHTHAHTHVHIHECS